MVVQSEGKICVERGFVQKTEINEWGFALYYARRGDFIWLKQCLKEKYTMPSETSNYLYEIDFLISSEDKISPIKVKSGNYREHKSLDVFCGKHSSRIRDKYVVHTKDYQWENGIHYLPVYMVPFL
jgi:hypothetical protein